MPAVEAPRHAEAFVGINGVNIWGDIKEYVDEIEFVEVATGATDSFDITMHDEAQQWINEWIIDKGTLINAKIKLCNWDAPGTDKWIDCGEFLCDGLSVRGYPLEATIKSLALPLNGTKNTKQWENISIRAIAEDICKWIGCELLYYADDISLKSRQQSRQTDIEFLYSLCKEYGLGMKVYRHKIIIFDLMQRDAEDVAETINLHDIADGFSLDDNEEGTYTGVKTSYKPESSDDEISYTYGDSKRLLVLETSATSAQEAELKSKAALYEANSEAVRLKFTSSDSKAIYCGTNYYFTGLGVYSGKYGIDRITLTMSGNNAYSASVEAHAITLEKDKKENADTRAAAVTEIAAGRQVILADCPLYISSDAAKAVRNITGTYYLYDGKDFSGRYRICNAGEVGAKPISANITGYIDGSYIN